MGLLLVVVILLLAEVVLFPYWFCSVLSHFIKIYSQKFLYTDLFFHCVVCQVQAFQNGRPEYLLTKPRWTDLRLVCSSARHRLEIYFFPSPYPTPEISCNSLMPEVPLILIDWPWVSSSNWITQFLTRKKGSIVCVKVLYCTGSLVRSKMLDLRRLILCHLIWWQQVSRLGVSTDSKITVIFFISGEYIWKIQGTLHKLKLLAKNITARQFIPEIQDVLNRQRMDFLGF